MSSSKSVLESLTVLEPVAQAIVTLKQNMQTMVEIEAKTNSVQAQLDAAQQKLEAVKTDHKKYSADVAAARDEVARTQAQLSELKLSTKRECEAMLAQAKADAQAAADAIKQARKNENASIEAQIVNGRTTLATLEKSIVAKRQDHDQILASMTALKARL